MGLNKTILVIEDDSDIRDGLKELLESEGYSIDSAANGLVGLKYLETTRPVAILLDLMMPVMDGYAFLNAIQQSKSDAIKSVPVILITAAGMKSKVNEGVYKTIKKPIDIDQLIRILASIS